MVNVAILASGSGTNFEAIVKVFKKRKQRRVNICLLITDKKHAYARVRARKYKVKDIFIDPRQFASRAAFEKEIVRVLEKERIGLIVLAGFMRILTSYFVKRFKNKILNIHPALLPSFRGTHAIERAYRHGVKVTGVTVHFVDDKVDHGPIIFQKSLEVKPGESCARLEQRIHRLEHHLYPKAVAHFCEGKLKIRGRRVEIRR